MRGQNGPFGFMMVFAAVLVIGMAVFYLYNVAILPQIKQGTGQLMQVTQGPTALVKSASAACEAWRSPQSFYDPSALSESIIEAVNKIFPSMNCAQDTPINCEHACACLYQLSKYCHIGDPGSSTSACLTGGSEECRLVVEG